MISRASLFNKGIYKSTLRRYLWGGVLYFILLFMITGMSILLNYSNDYSYLPKVRIDLDRPFVYMIIDRENMMPIMIGTLMTLEG